ncbi:winged helix-turn-helix domain-containing protein [Streptomyces sp. NPDC058914]|uniref:winged helix-turn-helix domain-containing protein n=1 Tax=Streptomyces TaxID=1883 RepID=UPI0036BE8D8A
MTAASRSRTGRVRVLIVDDEPALTEVFSVAVTEAGRRSYPAPDRRSALRTARGCLPHAVVRLGPLREHPRRVLRKAQMFDPVWSSSFDGGGNLVEVYISSLRRTIDRERAPVIHAVRGLGYAIRAAEDGR